MYWLLRPWRHAFDFSGRSPRREYWLFVLQFWLLVFLPALVFPIMRDAGLADGGRVLDNSFATIVAVILLFSFVPGLAVAVRRLHDQDKSGLLLFIWIIPAGGLILLLLMLFDGSEGENLYGPDPREDEMLEGMSEIFD